ncbi:MAG: hypothetical protein PHC54_03020 [Candidatus Omnitrophica bacterium]|nr:hypothetical protein [Candidatus Omnitrophota bacterium]MDD5592153.1 hypothetical protein [Candidatus Omnitrophota bacterium]
MYSSEKELYPEIIKWLEKYLEGKYPKAEIKAYDTSRQDLSEFLRHHKLHSFFPEFETYVIKIDITASIKHKDKCDLAFVECKLNSINLNDISQLLGYSRVVRPRHSFIISPNTISAPVSTLIKIFKRYDILDYATGARIRIAQWNKITQGIDISTLLPPGEHL